MTVLVAATDGNKTILASDKQACGYHTFCVINKQFKHRNITFAMTGKLASAQLVQYKLKLPLYNEDHTDDSYMFDVAMAIRELFAVDKKYQNMDCEFIAIYKGVIYEIDTNYCVIPVLKSFKGCGNDIARGAFNALSELPLKERVERCIEITNEESLLCGQGIDIQTFDVEK